MKVWAAYNGWMDESSVAALVEADSEAAAREIATLMLRAAEEDRAARLKSRARESYWTIQTIEPVPLPCIVVFGRHDYASEAGRASE